MRLRGPLIGIALLAIGPAAYIAVNLLVSEPQKSDLLGFLAIVLGIVCVPIGVTVVCVAGARAEARGAKLAQGAAILMATALWVAIICVLFGSMGAGYWIMAVANAAAMVIAAGWSVLFLLSAWWVYVGVRPAGGIR